MATLKEVFMNSIDVFWYAWPWFGLGAAVVMLVVLFATEATMDRAGATPCGLRG